MGKKDKAIADEPVLTKKKMKKLRRKVTSEMVEDLYCMIQTQREEIETLRGEREVHRANLEGPR